MKERDALKEGLHYTGMTFSPWDTSEAERYKARAAAYRKKYKNIRLVLVDCSDGYKAYYGNDNFRKIQYFDADAKANYIANYEERKAKAAEEYRKVLAKLEGDQLKAISEYADAMALMK